MKDALFVAVGDGGNPSTAQDLQSRLGKILRYESKGRSRAAIRFPNLATGAPCGPTVTATLGNSGHHPSHTEEGDESLLMPLDSSSVRA